MIKYCGSSRVLSKPAASVENFSRIFFTYSVMLLQVILQKLLLTKMLATLRTHRPDVHLGVPLQVLFQPKHGSAQTALVRLVSRMQIPMHLQLVRSPELLPAHAAREPVHVRVEQLVDVQGRFLSESLAAGIADERPRVRVDVEVIVARRLGGEPLAADVARVLLHAVMVLVDVPLQPAQDPEPPAADVAEELADARVDALVPDEVVRLPEEFPARLAFVVGFPIARNLAPFQEGGVLPLKRGGFRDRRVGVLQFPVLLHVEPAGETLVAEVAEVNRRDLPFLAPRPLFLLGAVLASLVLLHVVPPGVTRVADVAEELVVDFRPPPPFRREAVRLLVDPPDVPQHVAFPFEGDFAIRASDCSCVHFDIRERFELAFWGAIGFFPYCRGT